MTKSICLNCGVEFVYRKSQSRGKYCSNQCQQDYKWLHETKPNILEGKVKRSGTLRRFLIEESKYECVICGNNGNWQNNNLVLEIDHIDGNRNNNKPNNLRFLCPNCHSQTDTFRVKNSKYMRP